MIQLSDAAARIQGQEMFQILAKAKELEGKGKSILHFELGDPDFDTPVNVVDAACSAIRGGDTHYTPSSGLIELKRKAQSVTERSRGFSPELDQLVVCPGANVQIYYAIACTVNPGEEVIIPDPGFVTYRSILRFLGAKAVSVPLREEDGFSIRVDDIEKAITPATKMIIVNSPSNPTGGVVGEEEWRKIYELAVKNGIFILSDEVYARMVYADAEEPFFSPSTLDHCKENTILVNGFSKSYAMTGWRLGYMIINPAWVSVAAKVHQNMMISAAEFVQKAGAVAIAEAEGECAKMAKAFNERRKFVLKRLGEGGLDPGYDPKGAFYVFLRYPKKGIDSLSLSMDILEKAGVAMTPGIDFGPGGEGFIRISYANSMEHLDTAITRLEKYFFG